MGKIRIVFIVTAVAVITISLSAPALAGAPGGSFWFQFFTQTQTGSDNTGDGGTGNPADYNYYYVGQSWTTRADVSIGVAHPSNGADLVVTYNKDVVTAATPVSLSAYQFWAGISVDNGLGKATISGYNNAGVYYTGQRQYSNITWSAIKPTVAAYGLTATKANIDFTPGVSTDTNIARDGLDWMDSEEDFWFQVWADTKKPYGQNPSPATAAVGVAVEDPYLFRIRDSKNGEGDDTGVGTGISSLTAGRQVDVVGGTTLNFGGTDTCSYSGTWQTVCDFTANPSSPLGIPGDNRNWEYSTAYTVTVGGFKDKASPAQNQLGDANGPNTMDTKVWTFTTEADTTPPTAIAVGPTAGQTNVSVATDIWVDVLDKKSASVSGVGVDAPTCSIDVTSPSWGVTNTYISTSPEMTIVNDPTGYGKRFEIDPAVNFAQNETVSVSVYGCLDLVGNPMVTYNYTFMTVDATPPNVSSTVPLDDAVAPTGTHVWFHILDDGVGVNLGQTVIYVNGTYYKQGGGAGSVSINGTSVPFSSSVDFTPYVSGTSADYGFDIVPSSTFAAGDSVPVIVYTRDFSSNIMQRLVYSFVTEGGLCVAGSSYCGTDTSWDPATLMCIGTGGGGGGGSASCGSNTYWDGTHCVGNQCYCGGGGGGGVTVTSTTIQTVDRYIEVPVETVVEKVVNICSGATTTQVVYRDRFVPRVVAATGPTPAIEETPSVSVPPSSSLSLEKINGKSSTKDVAPTLQLFFVTMKDNTLIIAGKGLPNDQYQVSIY